MKEGIYLEMYELLLEINRKEIIGEEMSQREREDAVSVFLSGICDKEEIVKYKKCMRVNPATDSTYPSYYIPPYNGAKKYRLVQGYLPKTNLLYANHYELEILRLLCLFAAGKASVDKMIKSTLHRLQAIDFWSAFLQSESAVLQISALRFLAAVYPNGSNWIDNLLDPLGKTFLSLGPGQAAIQKGIPLSYLLMAFTDINSEKTKTLIFQKKEWLLNLLRRGWITGKLSNGKISEGDTYNLMFKYIIRNALGTLPKYHDIAAHRIYVDPEDERCYCDI